MGLVTGLARLAVDAADLINVLDTSHPLIHGELDLASEVVDVTDQSTKNLTVAGSGVGAHAVNDILGEVGVESVRSHLACCGDDDDDENTGINNTERSKRIKSMEQADPNV